MSIYSELFYSSEIEELFSEKKTIAQMLRFEANLALAQAEIGVFSISSAQLISDCCDVEKIDIEKLKKDIKLSGNAAIPLVKQLTQLVKNNAGRVQNPASVEATGENASKYVHLGATSQDVIDTAMVLQIQEFIVWLENKLTILEDILIKITKKHRQTLMIGRTLLQQAKPITFGLKTALWFESIRASKQRIEESKKRVLILKLGGAVGSGNDFINKKVQKSMATYLQLAPPSGGAGAIEFSSILSILVGNLAKIAKDIILLMQTEVGEVFEGAADGKGGSSTMPHKRNPVTSTAILANANRIPHLVASMLSAMPQEHERSAGLWHSEWEVLPEIIRLTAGTIERSIELLEGLEIDEKRMLQNLEITKGLIYAETVSLALAQKIGKANAHEIIEKACKLAIFEQKHLKIVMQEMNIDLTENELTELFKPENSIGNSLEIIDDILEKYEK